MIISIRGFVRNLLFAIAPISAALSIHTASAQPSMSVYPTKPVRVLVGLAPGGAIDVQARWIAQKLTEQFGRQFVIDNRAGAGGLIAYELTANAPRDGYTLVAASPSLTIAPALQAHVPVDPVRDFAPVSLVTRAPYIVVVIPSFAATSMAEFIAYARARPDQVLVGASGRTAIHLGAMWLARATNIELTIVTYKGNAPVIADMLAGQLHATLSNVLSARPLLKSGRLRALAVTTLQRSSVLPDLPTVAESGVPGFNVDSWHGWMAPKGTPRAVVMLLNRALANAVGSTDVAEKLAADGASGIGGSPEEFGQHIAQEILRWKTVIGKLD
jgi:tripartite-type tricarboxylate transporter receptor subunit TctC